jgi:hypothetical protein
LQVCALNVLFVLFVVVGVVSPSLFTLMSHLCQCWAAIVILAKMTYQLSFISEEEVVSNCTVCFSHSLNPCIPSAVLQFLLQHVANFPYPNTSHDQLPYPFNGTIDNAEYIGLQKSNNLATYLRVGNGLVISSFSTDMFLSRIAFLWW